MLYRLLPVCFVCLLGLFAGCSATVAPPIADKQALTDSQGAVVFKLVNSGQDGGPSDFLTSIKLEKEKLPGEAQEGRPTSFVLYRSRLSSHSTAVFSGMLPAGRYAVLEASGGSPDEGATYRFPMESMLSSFDVKAGEVSLLGTLLVHPVGGRRFTVTLLPPEEELFETFQSVFPTMARQSKERQFSTLDRKPDLQQGTSSIDEFNKSLALAEYPAIGGVWQSSDGAFFAGGKIGRAYWRNAGDTRWRELNVGSWRQVLVLRPYRNGLIAAGEEGLLRMSADQGRTWSRLDSPDRGVIYGLVTLPNGKALAVTRIQSEWNAYTSEDLVTGRWTKIGSFKQESQSASTHQPLSFVVSMGEKIGVMTAGGTFYVVDGGTERIQIIDGGKSVSGLSIQPDGLLLRVGGFPRSFSISHDGGNKWAELNLSRFTLAVAAKNRTTIYAVSLPKSQLFTSPKTEYALMTSRDGGLTWNQTGLSPERYKGTTIRNMLVDHFDGSLWVFMANGKSMRSRDEGKTWDDDERH